MVKRERQRSLLEELFEQFPRGIALVELTDPEDESSWRLAAINSRAASLVSPSIETFLSSTKLRLGAGVDLPNLYREIVTEQRIRTIGMFEARGSRLNGPLYMVVAFPVGTRGVGLLFENTDSSVTERRALARAEQELAQTCEFVGAILWTADAETLHFTFVSPQARAILGYWLERWTGETGFWRKHVYPDDWERVTSACEQILRERRRQDFEFRMISVHGQTFWFHAAAEIAEKRDGRPVLVGVMNDITGLKRAEERIRSLTARLMRLQDDERRHISRELHDSLGQYLTSIKLNLELVRRESTSISEQHKALLAESSEHLQRCVQEVRTVSYLLYPPLLEELGLLAALRWFTAGFGERSGIEVNFKAPEQFSRLPAEMELAIFRIVQESVTNIQRHSRSDSAWVTLSESKDGAEIRISDNGVGMPAEVIERIKQGNSLDGVGLRGMYERLRELGGRLEIESSKMGTAVSAVLPLRRANRKRGGGEGEGRKRRFAGKPLETTDVRIETADGSDAA